LFIDERHREILRIISEAGRISVGDIENKFNISQDSARRDLRILEEKGLLKRTHGGAIPLQQVRHRAQKNTTPRDDGEGTKYHNSIAKRAASFIGENDVIFISSAFLGYLMTHYLPEDKNFTVITNSIIVADELKHRENIDTFIVGGKIRDRGSIYDSIAIEFIKNIKIDINFITGVGFTARYGLSNTNHETAIFQRILIENSRKNICLMSNSKLGFEGFVKVADTNKFDILITDWEAFEEEINKIQDCGIDVIITEESEDDCTKDSPQI